QAGPGDLEKEKLAGRETFLEKGSPSPRPLLSKNFCRWACLLPAGLRMDGNGVALAVKMLKTKIL
ncbi:hypothetical protein, partial [Desulfovibrio piger]|uniref:hypothetical protein n=1 Tax=Desulfovibrio piger TaxID=901 RepID=UPI0026F151EC